MSNDKIRAFRVVSDEIDYVCAYTDGEAADYVIDMYELPRSRFVQVEEVDLDEAWENSAGETSPREVANNLLAAGDEPPFVIASTSWYE